VALWWLDHGDRVGGELLPGIPSRNLFGAVWAGCTQRFAEQDGGGRQLSLIRGAGIGGQRAAMPWPGDTRFGVDFFLDDLRFCLNAGLSGFPVTSADLGGFMPAARGDAPHNTAFDDDNLARRLCHAMLVIPVPRMHQSDAEPPKLPWNCPAHIQVLYRRMLEERYRLTPYYYSYAVEAARTGEPIVRPMLYRYQDDPEARLIEDQCLIGDWILAAPVFTKGAVDRSVYLPPGQWICWWTGRRYEGGRRITVEAPLCEPRGVPLFVRAGAVVPTQDAVNCLADAPPSSLTLEVYPSVESTGTLWEEGGRQTVFTCRMNKAVDLEIQNRTGVARRFTIRFHGVEAGTTVRVNGLEHAVDGEGPDVRALCLLV
jgi:alpha-glucosidase